MVKDYEFLQILQSMFSELDEWTRSKEKESDNTLFQVEYENDYKNNKLLVNIIEYFQDDGEFENNKYRITFERMDKDDEDYDKTMDL